MDAYINKKFYEESYRGAAIPPLSFDNLALKASYQVNHFCFNRIGELQGNEHEEAIKMATCAAAEEMYRLEKTDGKSSESVGKHSVTYNTRGTPAQKIQSAISPYLTHTGLMYRGGIR